MKGDGMRLLIYKLASGSSRILHSHQRGNSPSTPRVLKHIARSRAIITSVRSPQSSGCGQFRPQDNLIPQANVHQTADDCLRKECEDAQATRRIFVCARL